MHATVPRKLWIYWEQGLSDAPVVVAKCVESWRRLNPGWDIVLLDGKNLHEYVDLQIPEKVLANLSRAHRSDLVRLDLLSKRGGVWADATTYCMQALDEWVDDCCESGFFVFHQPRRDLLISNWFMASTKANPIVEKLYADLSAYWVQNRFSAPNILQKVLRRILAAFLNRKISMTRYWFTPLVTKLFRIYPYFVFHYMFASLVANDREFAAIWGKTKKVDAHLPHLIQRSGMFVYPENSIKQRIEESGAPLFKLNWRYASNEYRPDTLIYYLFEQRKKSSAADSGIQ